jgi:penicillin amidase/acyl-homoserine-lactone acylase
MAPRPSRPLRFTLALLAVALALTVAFLPGPPRRERLFGLRDAGKEHDVRVLRDEWGVPHVYGKTDADVAFGLAYAHAEDDFASIQGALLASRGRLASVYGRDRAVNDYLVALLRIGDFVDAKYEKDLSPETRALCEAYAAGVNRYAALHPQEVLPGLFPARGKDVVAGFVHKLPLFFGLERVLGELMSDERRQGVSRKGEARAARYDSEPDDALFGSNAFAVAPKRSADGFTRLSINSHQPWTGPVAWYEARVHSEEGWDMAGGFFPGTPVVLHGHNRNLGWAHTVNRPDLIDVYVLEVNPENPSQYRFDGEWRDFEVGEARIDVKVWRGLHYTARRETLWSVHGPVLRRPHGTYAIRFANLGEIRMVEQWYRMNKARNLEEWRAALGMGALPMFNCAYADREGNIAHVYNARIPRRAPGYDWSAYLPGDTSETLWTEYLSLDELPQVTNPPSGVIFNANSTPFEVTLGDGNPDPAAYPESLGIERRMTNRALRAQELLGDDESITREELDRYKLDLAYSQRSSVVRRWKALVEGPEPQSPALKSAVSALARWDLKTNADNVHAALALLTLRPRFDDSMATLDRSDLLHALESTADALRHTFGRTDVPWGEVQRLRRGSLDLPLSGGPDVLRAIYARTAEDGRREAFAGDSYILQVEWDREGRVHSRSVHPFGSATQDARSPHYADQAPLFAKGELKAVWLDESDLRPHVTREYRPGQVER